jgi:hypothetical protein
MMMMSRTSTPVVACASVDRASRRATVMVNTV